MMGWQWWGWEEGGGRDRRCWTWQAVIVTHHLHLNPFNNHRRSAHKALSTPCFLLPPLPWRSNYDTVPTPLHFTSVHKDVRPHTHCVAAPWLFSQGVQRSLWRPWTGVEPISGVAIHPITAGLFRQDPHRARRLVVSPAAQRAADDSGMSAFRLSGSCAGKLQSF